MLLVDRGTAQELQVSPQSPDQAPTVSTGHGWHDFWAGVDLHRQRVNAWPDPFVLPDRDLVRNPFRLMADNGWKLQNTLSDHLFVPDTNELTYAGQLKLRWVMTQVPPHRRQLFVLEGPSEAATATRVASVYKSLGEIAPGTPPCAVFTTRIAPPAGDGSYLDHVDQSYRISMPAPRLPAGAVNMGGPIGNSAAAGGPLVQPGG
jgi:hypothetical protein